MKTDNIITGELIIKHGVNIVLKEKPLKRIASVFGNDAKETQANASLIVSAVNNHAALIEALKHAIGWIEEINGQTHDTKIYKQLLQKIESEKQ